MLPGGAHLDAALDLLVGRVRETEADDRSRVVLRLQQPGDELQLVGAQQGGGLFQAEVHLEPAGQDVAVPVPPAGGVGLLRELQQRGPLVRVGDAVQGQQVGDVALLEADAAELHAADLRMGAADLVARLLGGDAAGLAQPPQLCAEENAQDGGAAAARIIDQPSGRITLGRRCWGS